MARAAGERTARGTREPGSSPGRFPRRLLRALPGDRNKRYRYRTATGTPSPLTRAARLQAHLDRLVGWGLSYESIAQASGVSAFDAAAGPETPAESTAVDLGAVRTTNPSTSPDGHQAAVPHRQYEEPPMSSPASVQVHAALSALAPGVPHLGPRYHAGRIPMGQDGQGGEPEWVSYDDAGVRGGVIVGDPGSGKSVLIDALALAKHDAREWRIRSFDGDGLGCPSPLLTQIAHEHAAGPREMLEQLRVMEELVRARSVLKPTLTTGAGGKPEPISVHTQAQAAAILPSPRYPGHIWFIDDFHRLTNDPRLTSQYLVSRLEAVARRMPKLGAGIVVGTTSLLARDFGGSTTLRDLLVRQNLVVLRSASWHARCTAGGVDLDPTSLPRGGGYAYHVVGDRARPFRVAWSPDMRRYVAGIGGGR